MVTDSRQTSGGGIAQLGERLNGIQEVSGSIPLTSTNENTRGYGIFFVTPFLFGGTIGELGASFLENKFVV